MKIPLFIQFVVAVGFWATTTQAATRPEVVSLGNNTYSITRQASNGFVRDAEKLKAEALDQAAAYCADQHKQLKVISATAEKPKIMFMGYASAKVVFKALDAGDPELSAPAATGNVANSDPASGTSAETVPVRTPTDALYNELMRLDDLRKRGILTDEEFQAQKKKVLERSK